MGGGRFEKDKHTGSAGSGILRYRQTDTHIDILLLLYKDLPRKAVGDMIPVRLATNIAVPDSIIIMLRSSLYV